jgi:uncharacterized protein
MLRACCAIGVRDRVLKKIRAFISRNMPTRAELEENRFMRPFASRVLRPELWRFTRRSVPRGVALGMFLGIFLMIPGVQFVGTALAALSVRANVPVALGMTLLSNPVTTPFILVAATAAGNRTFQLSADVSTVKMLIAKGASLSEWSGWLFSDAAPAMIGGLFIIGAISAAVCYMLSVIGWRWWIGRKWQRRKRKILSASN